MNQEKVRYNLPQSSAWTRNTNQMKKSQVSMFLGSNGAGLISKTHTSYSSLLMSENRPFIEKNHYTRMFSQAQNNQEKHMVGQVHQFNKHKEIEQIKINEKIVPKQPTSSLTSALTPKMPPVVKTNSNEWSLKFDTPKLAYQNMKKNAQSKNQSVEASLEQYGQFIKQVTDEQEYQEHRRMKRYFEQFYKDETQNGIIQAKLKEMNEIQKKYAKVTKSHLGELWSTNKHEFKDLESIDRKIAETQFKLSIFERPQDHIDFKQLYKLNELLSATTESHLQKFEKMFPDDRNTHDFLVKDLEHKSVNETKFIWSKFPAEFRENNQEYFGEIKKMLVYLHTNSLKDQVPDFDQSEHHILGPSDDERDAFKEIVKNHVLLDVGASPQQLEKKFKDDFGVEGAGQIFVFNILAQKCSDYSPIQAEEFSTRKYLHQYQVNDFIHKWYQNTNFKNRMSKLKFEGRQICQKEPQLSVFVDLFDILESKQINKLNQQKLFRSVKHLESLDLADYQKHLIQATLVRYEKYELRIGHHLIPKVVKDTESALKNIEGLYLRYHDLMKADDESQIERIKQWLKGNSECEEWRIDFLDLTKAEYDQLDPVARRMYLHLLKRDRDIKIFELFRERMPQLTKVELGKSTPTNADEEEIGILEAKDIYYDFVNCPIKSQENFKNILLKQTLLTKKQKNWIITQHNMSDEEHQYGAKLYFDLCWCEQEELIKREDVDRLYILSLEWPKGIKIDKL